MKETKKKKKKLQEAERSRRIHELAVKRDGPTTTSLPSMLRLSFSVVKKYQPHHVTWLRKLQFASLENSHHVFIRSLRSPTSKFSDQMAGWRATFYFLCITNCSIDFVYTLPLVEAIESRWTNARDKNLGYRMASLFRLLLNKGPNLRS
mgnify:FL=1